MVAQEVLLRMGWIMGSYLRMAQVDFEGIHSEFLLWFDDLHIEYNHELCFHSTFYDDS